MRLRLTPARVQESRIATLAAVILVQGLCAMFFVADVIGDAVDGTYGGGLHLDLETIAAAALCLGVGLMLIELRDMLRRIEVMDRGLRAARGDMAGLIERFFRRWGLTPSEREVALLILKGFDNASIAGLRGVASGTVRAQTARVYAKAGVEGRAQLFSVFMEELLADPEAQEAWAS